MTNTEYLRARLLANVFEPGGFDLSKARASQAEFFGERGVVWEVIEHAKVRKLLGAFRYEQRGANSASYDERARARSGGAKTYVQRAKEKFDLYERTGNKEFLVDAFNYVLLEWARPYHPNAHFESTDRNPEIGED